MKRSELEVALRDLEGKDKCVLCGKSLVKHSMKNLELCYNRIIDAEVEAELFGEK